MAKASLAALTPESVHIPPGLEGLSESEAAPLRIDVGPNRWVPVDRLTWLRETLRLLLDPMAVMLAIAAAIYVALGKTRGAGVLALALIPVLGAPRSAVSGCAREARKS